MTQQYAGIQLLRFVAAMLVVVMHTSQAISIHITGQGRDQYWHDGAAGVDIFFVISGFVMTVSTRAMTGGGPSRRRAAWIFIQRRLLRIAPLYWFYTLLKVALLLAVPGLAVTSSIDALHLATSLSFFPSVSPWGMVQPVLPVGWTLNFEMLFYTVFAIAMALGAPRGRFCLLIFLLIFLCAHLFPQDRTLVFYGQAIVFEFILGVVIATILLRYPAPPAVFAALSILTGIVFIFGVDWPVDVDRFINWGLGAAAIVMGMLWLEPKIVNTRFAPQFSIAGDASYSIYLSHTFVVPAGVLVLRSIGVHNNTAVIFLVCGAVVATGFASYRWLEKPMTSYLKRMLFRAPPRTDRNDGNIHAN